jgi:hypothetical protein
MLPFCPTAISKWGKWVLMLMGNRGLVGIIVSKQRNFGKQMLSGLDILDYLAGLQVVMKAFRLSALISSNRADTVVCLLRVAALSLLFFLFRAMNLTRVAATFF